MSRCNVISQEGGVSSRERGAGHWAEGLGDKMTRVRGTWDPPGAESGHLLGGWWKGSELKEDGFWIIVQVAPWTNSFWIKQAAGLNQTYSHSQDLLDQDFLGLNSGIFDKISSHSEAPWDWESTLVGSLWGSNLESADKDIPRPDSPSLFAAFDLSLSGTMSWVFYKAAFYLYHIL